MRGALWMVALVAAGPGLASAQATPSGPIEVALRMEGSRLIVPVALPDGTELPFIVSTGVPMTILSESTATRLGDGGQLSLGGVAVPLADHRTMPDERLVSSGFQAAGMVGTTLLSNYDLLIDVPGGRMVLKPFGRAVSWEGMALSDPVRLRIYHGVVLALDVELNGSAFGAQLDLGTSALVVNPPVAAALGLEAADTGALTLGSAVLRDLAVRTEELEVFERWDPEGSGFVIVGAVIARDCPVAISWVHRELRTCPR